MATVKFKNEGEKIVMIGRETLTSENLTAEKYLALINEYPGLTDKFEVNDDPIDEDAEKDSSTANNE